MARFSSRRGALILAAAGLLVGAAALLSALRLPTAAQSQRTPTAAGSAAASRTLTRTSTATSTSPAPSASPTSSPTAALSLPVSALPGTIYLSILEDGYTHLFAYQPANGLTRLTAGEWDDAAPAPSPDGLRLAFRSNRSGAWDLYILELASGETRRLTDTAEYEGSPGWSPDGLFLAYEAYTGAADGLDLFIRPVDGNQPPIRLTGGETLPPTPTVTPTRPPAGRPTATPLPPEEPPPAVADFAPAWSPGGRQVAFVSTRAGRQDIWLADLDRVDGRFRNLTGSRRGQHRHPAWSPDGLRLAWSSDDGGMREVYMVEPANPAAAPQRIAAGDWPAWASDGLSLAVLVETPNDTYLAAYSITGSLPKLLIPALPMPGPAFGLAWGASTLPESLADPLAAAARLSPTPPWQAALTPLAGIPGGRQRLVELADVQAPQPLLQDLVDESFIALRQRIGQAAGWDVLASLENAFVPITAPLAPAALDGWLHTGRAIALNPAPQSAGWLVTVREDFGAQVYWRVYVRARLQDGRLGQPLTDLPWDLRLRYSGDPRFYEAGGAELAAIPSGYWVDFTSLARAYGWERLPALLAWRADFNASRFNQFVHADGLDWEAAMLELYPAEALATATPVLPPSLTPTRTLRPSLTPTATRTRFPTRTPTPTRTPLASPTPAATPAP